jgi:hypothetical protein
MECAIFFNIVATKGKMRNSLQRSFVIMKTHNFWNARVNCSSAENLFIAVMCGCKCFSFNKPEM